MAGEWKETTLGSLLSFTNGRSSPQRADDLLYPVYGSNGIIGKANEANADEDTIIIGRVGSYCGSLYFSNHRCWVTDNAIRATALGDNNPRFLFYLLNALSLNNLRAGSGQPLLNQEILGCIPVSVPSALEQCAIARILGSLDDKIEANRRMNETLEAIARALFKSWFVDFDPVRARAEGRAPAGMDAETAALFPDSFEETELGMVPKGWGVKTVGDVLELAYGKALKEENRIAGNIPVFGSNGQVGWHNKKLVNGPGIIVGRKGNPGIVTWSPTDFFSIDTTFYVVLKSICKSMHYVFHSLGQQDLASLGADSAVPGLNRNLAYMNTIVIPFSTILEVFDKYVAILKDLVHVNKIQSHNLSAIRELLLPKLLSREIEAVGVNDESIPFIKSSRGTI